MKLIDIFALFTLSVIVKSAWWAAAVQPVILSLGAVLSAIDLDVLDVQPVKWKNWLPFKEDRGISKEVKEAAEKFGVDENEIIHDGDVLRPYNEEERKARDEMLAHREPDHMNINGETRAMTPEEKKAFYE